MYDESPSETAKEYYADNFAYSLDLTDDDKETIAIYRRLSAADWDYIIDNCHNNMGKWGLQQAKKKYETKK